MTGPTSDHGSAATMAGLAGLAREIEALRHAVGEAAGLRQRVEDLAAVVADLAIAVEQLTASPSVKPPACWLDFADSEADAFALLAELAAWTGAVFLRYGDATLPDCWLWHADLVEELLWLSQAWQAAYAGPRPSIALAGDWHDRQRPGAARRIRATHGACSIENHADPRPAPVAPADGAELIAAWWTTQRTDPAPAPTAELLAAAAARPSRSRR